MEILSPVQLDGLRMLLVPMPHEEFNATDVRKTAQPFVGVTCFDPKQPIDIEALLSKADSLMYEQKRRRKGRPSMVFSP